MADVVIYTRQMCGFCTAAKNLLSKKGVKFVEHDGTFSQSVRKEMMEKSKRTTFPQIFINGRHVGGSDELHALERAGKLDPLLSA